MEKVMVVEANYGSPVTVGARREFSIPIDGKTLFEFEDDGHADIYIREPA